MVLRRSTLTLIFVYIILFFALRAKPISSHGIEEIPAPSLPKLGELKSSIDQNNNYYTQRTITRLEVIKGALEEYIPWLANKKACSLTPPEQKPCCDQCQENYGVALDCVKRSIESINKQDIPKAKSDINGITTNMQTCADCFVALGDNEESIKGINLWAKQATQECLACLQATENGVQKLSVDQNDKEEFPAPSLPKLGVLKSSIDDGTQAAIAQLEIIKGALEEYIPWLANKKACWQTPPEAKPCCDQCQENYGVALDCVKRSIESINKKDFPKAKCDINGIATNMQTCYDCFVASGNGEDHVKSINLWAKHATEECLDSLKTAENGVQKLSVNQNDKEEIPVAPSLPKIGVQKSSVDPNNEAAKVTIERLEAIKPTVEAYKEFFGARMACGLTPPEAKKCCGQCQKDLADAIKGVKVSIASIKKEDYPKAHGDINGIVKDIQKCNDCFIRTANGEDSGAKQIYVWTKAATDDCLLHLKNAEIESQEL